MLPFNKTNSKLDSKALGLLVFSFTVLIVLGRFIVSQLGLMAVLNIVWTAEALSAFIFALPFAAWGTVAAGVAIFVYYGYKTHFMVDKFAVKKQFKKTLVLTSLVLCGLFLSSMVTVPLTTATVKVTTGYQATPYSPFDWLVGKYSTGTVYAINGSNWANLMTSPATTWASYASNETKVQELVLAATTAGTIYLKEVAFDYNTTIPANVQVIENVNGLTRVFVASSESVGSPYTISVDTVNPTYYMTQDSAGRYLDEFTSTNASYVINSAANSATNGGIIFFKNGHYTLTHSIIIPNGATSLSFIGEAQNGPTTTPGTVIQVAGGTNIDAFVYNSSSVLSWITFENLCIFGNHKNNPINGHGINLGGGSGAPQDGLIRHCFIESFTNSCILLTNPWAFKIESNTVEFGMQYGLRLSGGNDVRVMNNKFIYNTNGIYAGSAFSSFVGNFIFNNTQQGAYIGNQNGIIFTANNFYNNSAELKGGYQDIQIGANSQGCKIESNTFEGNNVAKYAILMWSGTDTFITGNTFRNYVTKPIANGGSTNLTVINNVGFVTERSFSGANTTATTAVLAHGLASTPTSVVTTGNDTALTFSVTAFNATYVTITSTGTPTGNWTVYCNAVYKP